MSGDCVKQLERMFQDIRVSEDLNQEFKNSKEDIEGQSL
jgi:hypothetical protein